MHFATWLATGAKKLTEAAREETTRVEWKSLGAVRNLLRAGEIQDGPSLTALAVYFTVEDKDQID